MVKVNVLILQFYRDFHAVSRFFVNTIVPHTFSPTTSLHLIFITLFQINVAVLTTAFAFSIRQHSHVHYFLQPYIINISILSRRSRTRKYIHFSVSVRDIHHVKQSCNETVNSRDSINPFRTHLHLAGARISSQCEFF